MSDCVNFRCTTYLSMCVYFKIITIRSFVNIHHLTVINLFLVIRSFRIYPFSNFQTYNIALLASVAML